MNYKQAIAGAVSGFLAAFVVDVNAWSKANAPFDWALASKRWISGAITGFVGALGMAQIAG